MEDDFTAVRFSYELRMELTQIFRLRQRVCAIPVSSCPIDTVFSAVHNIVSRDRFRTSSSSQEDIVVLRCLHS